MKSENNIEKLIKKANAIPSSEMNSRILKDIFEAQEESKRISSAIHETTIWKIIFGRAVYYFVIVLLIVSLLVTSFVLYRKNTGLKNELEQAHQDISDTPIEDSVEINFYLKEHQDTIFRNASHNSSVSQSLQMQINQQDIMYYELFGNQSNSGMILNEPLSQQKIDSSGSSTISNGHVLTFSEARKAIDFDIVSPTWFHPCYMLSQLRIIEDHDALQLLYTNGINSISLFEQSLDGQNGLSHHDFREYAVYNNQGESGGTILAWRDDTLSYVLIGNTELSQLMDMAQSINARK